MEISSSEQLVDKFQNEKVFKDDVVRVDLHVFGVEWEVISNENDILILKNCSNGESLSLKIDSDSGYYRKFPNSNPSDGKYYKITKK